MDADRTILGQIAHVSGDSRRRSIRPIQVPPALQLRGLKRIRIIPRKRSCLHIMADLLFALALLGQLGFEGATVYSSLTYERRSTVAYCCKRKPSTSILTVYIAAGNKKKAKLVLRTNCLNTRNLLERFEI
jgi:hypothetical protein